MTSPPRTTRPAAVRPSPRRPLRAIVLGYGFIGAMHTEAAALVRDVDVVGVSGHRLEPARAFAQRWAIERVTDDWASLCAEPDVDLVIVGTPNALHADQAIHALANGKHVLVDKPMAVTVADADRMIAAAADAERTLAVGHMWRHHSDVIALRDRIAAGDLGRVVRTHGWGVHAGWGPSGWFTDPQLAGGGALIDMGIHAIDTVRFLLGDPDPERVVASIGVGVHGGYAVDDDGVVLIDWNDGVRSTVEFGWWQPRLGGLEADTEVLGTAGASRIWTMPLPPPADHVHCTVPMYAAQLADVALACRSGRSPVSSAAVGRTALAIVDDAYRSAGLRA
jgi:predicted dehydrogenase